jgi:hypothetical protein
MYSSFDRFGQMPMGRWDLSHLEPAFDAINMKNVKPNDSHRLGIEVLRSVCGSFRDLGASRHFIVSIKFCALPRVPPCFGVPCLAALAADRSRHFRERLTADQYFRPILAPGLSVLQSARRGELHDDDQRRAETCC